MTSSDSNSPPATFIRFPGRVYEGLLDLAEKHVDGPDVDIAEALANPRMKRRGRGWTAAAKFTPEQGMRMAGWITDDQPKYMRRFRESLREDIASYALANGLPRSVQVSK